MILIPLAWNWYSSLVPSPLSVMDMGSPDYGGGPENAGHHAAGLHSVSVADLAGPATGVPSVAVRLVARQQRVTLAGGLQLDGFTLNGTSPGPTITATQGDLIQVTLHNDNVADGVTLHWHGVDVPNAEDGVAGVTQDAVPPGQDHAYRFVVPDAGTYWYHSHQASNPQVRGGLFGPLVVMPKGSEPGASTGTVAAVHTYSSRRTVNGRGGEQRVTASPGERVRVRVINTDNGPMRASVSGGTALIAAIDGHDVNSPSPIGDRYLTIPAGGRADLRVQAPGDGSAARIDLGAGVTMLVGPAGSTAKPAAAPTKSLDLLSYGRPATTALPFDPARPDRRFDYRIGREIGFLDGRPGFWWTINGHKYPDVPMFTVAEGDVVQMTISNGGLLGADIHPMHLHGHHAIVLSRDGVTATGSPWWVDSLDVAKGESYVIAFRADNPGIWMDHCHNLDHAEDGMIAHLMYEGVTEPYHLGGTSGGISNTPE